MAPSAIPSNKLSIQDPFSKEGIVDKLPSLIEKLSFYRSNIREMDSTRQIPANASTSFPLSLTITDSVFIPTAEFLSTTENIDNEMIYSGNISDILNSIKKKIKGGDLKSFLYGKINAKKDSELRIFFERNSTITSENLSKLILIAIKTEHLILITLFIGAGLDLSKIYFDSQLNIPIAIYACLKGNMKIFSLLESDRYDFSKLFDDGSTLLHYLARAPGEAQVRITQAIMKTSIDLSRPFKGYSAIHIAAMSGFDSFIKLMLAKNKELAMLKSEGAGGLTPLQIAVALQKHIETISLLTTKEALCIQDETHGYTPLHIALANGNLEIALFLINKEDCPLGFRDKKGNTPLHLAAKLETDIITKALLSRGAFSDNVNVKGYTPLFIAAKHKKNDSAKALLGRGADPLKKGKSSLTLMMLVAKTDNIGLALMIPKEQLGITEFDDHNNTALHWAISSHSEKIIDFILEINTFILYSRNQKGYTPLDLDTDFSLTNHIFEVAKITHPLHWSAIHGCLHTYNFLVRSKKIDEVDEKGKTAIAYAIESESYDIALDLRFRDASLNPSIIPSHKLEKFMAYVEETCTKAQAIYDRTINSGLKKEEDDKAIMHKSIELSQMTHLFPRSIQKRKFCLMV